MVYNKHDYIYNNPINTPFYIHIMIYIYIYTHIHTYIHMYIDQSLHLQSSSKSGQGPPCCWWPSATAPPRATPPAAPAPRWASVRWANCSWSSAAKRPTVARWEVHNETMVKLWIYGFYGFLWDFEWDLNGFFSWNLVICGLGWCFGCFFGEKIDDLESSEPC